jgi:hypothetical protein
MSSCLAGMGRRDNAEELMWLKTIAIDKDRPEGYLALSRYYSWRKNPSKAYLYAKMGSDCTKKNFKMTPNSSYSAESLEEQRIIFSNHDGKYDERKAWLEDQIKNNPNLPEWIKGAADDWKITK